MVSRGLSLPVEMRDDVRVVAAERLELGGRLGRLDRLSWADVAGQSSM